jgi:hypothetical protein
MSGITLTESDGLSEPWVALSLHLSPTGCALKVVMKTEGFATAPTMDQALNQEKLQILFKLNHS